jgi:D-sedoheptulose 7-phosphate isomerase
MNTFLINISECIKNISDDKIKLLKSIVKSANSPIIILGNGGSNAIASHIGNDYAKVHKKNVITFSDAGRITGYANDYGYDLAFVNFIKDFENLSPLVVLISSSGNSKNIVNSAEYCVKNKIPFIGLSGFDYKNSLNMISQAEALLSFHVDSKSYGVVECVHQIILHTVCDEI